MQVGYSMNHKKLGCIIVGGIDPVLFSNSDKIPYIVDKYILIKTKTEELTFRVKRMDLSTSIYGSLIIGITVFNTDNFSKIESGNHVFVLLDENS